jgi:hypothetical protein
MKRKAYIAAIDHLAEQTWASLSFERARSEHSPNIEGSGQANAGLRERVKRISYGYRYREVVQ